MTKSRFVFSCIDNSGKRQVFEVKAVDKTEAIKLGMTKARKYAKGDIGFSWNCKLVNSLMA